MRGDFSSFLTPSSYPFKEERRPSRALKFDAVVHHKRCPILPHNFRARFFSNPKHEPRNCYLRHLSLRATPKAFGGANHPKGRSPFGWQSLPYFYHIPLSGIASSRTPRNDRLISGFMSPNHVPKPLTYFQNFATIHTIRRQHVPESFRG